MKKKTLIFIIFALPIPVAVLGAAMSFIWLLTSLLTEETFFVEIIAAFFGVIIGSTYLVTLYFH